MLLTQFTVNRPNPQPTASEQKTGEKTWAADYGAEKPAKSLQKHNEQWNYRTYMQRLVFLKSNFHLNMILNNFFLQPNWNIFNYS